ncbi:MAG: tRNA 2-thiouridine(34) synthase MnmA [Clostridia bacterium]|nr:tRNA 2-thiouridine(34) synthase MnmA [Clostridia bacterium]
MRIAVGMSGGVDSSVAAYLLKRQGHEVIGVFMNNWDEQDENGVCTARTDWRDVQDVCDLLDIPYYAVDFSKEYMENVFQEFLSEYAAGRTPNPDVLCNREIKFKAFLDYAKQMGADRMATGHFVRTDDEGNLLKGADPAKDQSYFLYMVHREQLRYSLFPVGGMTKGEVREIARDAKIPVSEKKDSTGICFIGERNFKRFLSTYLPAQPGDIVLSNGEVVGRHDGLMYYTLGQRRGLGIGGRGDGRRFFVIEKDLKNNRLVVAQGDDDPRLYSDGCVCGDITFVGGPIPEGIPVPLTVKLRYRQADQPCVATLVGSRLLLRFEKPQRAVTPGQSAVLYDGEKCLGGGIIESLM